MATIYRLSAAVALAVLCFGLLFGCAPRQQGASQRSFYASGRANFNISVTPPLALASTGNLSATVPSDVSMPPLGSFRYALFTEGESGPVTRHAHMIFSELPREEWRWELETWALPESMSYEKTRAAGKYWTIQVMPVFSARDWFSALWQQNGREAPEFWLAKRWSATPEKHMRVVAEYREPAPLCLQRTLSELPLDDPHALPVRGKTLWRGCDREVAEFSARADAAFNFDRAENLPARPEQKAASLPSSGPDMARLVGRAENIERDSSRVRD